MVFSRLEITYDRVISRSPDMLQILALNAGSLRRDLSEQHELNLRALDELEAKIDSLKRIEPVKDSIDALPILCMSISSPGAPFGVGILWIWSLDS